VVYFFQKDKNRSDYQFGLAVHHGPGVRRREKSGPTRIPAYVVSYFFPASMQSGLGEQPENSQKT
jgi:hypothetical protein